MMSSNALATRRPGVWVFTYVYSFLYSVTITPPVNMTRALSAVASPRAKHTIRLPTSPPPDRDRDPDSNSSLMSTPAPASAPAPAPAPGTVPGAKRRPRPDHAGPWHAVEMAIEFSNLATWARVLTKVNMLGILPFMFETRLSPQAIIAMQDTLNRSFGSTAEESIRSGTTIFQSDDGLDPTLDRRSRIYDAALASKAVYTLSENLFGGQIPDPNAVRSLELLEERYVINKQNFYDFSPADHPRDSILLEPKDAGARGDGNANGDGGKRGKGFWVFAVKGTATAQDWIDDFDAGRNDNDHFNLKHQGILMTNEMEAKLRNLLGNGERVVFTGHSAGAAVAAYVYKELYRKDWKMDCVLFGPAATSKPDLFEPRPGTDGLRESVDDTSPENTNPNIRVAFCNRWDPVPRSTTAYVEWFLHTWSVYHQAKSHGGGEFVVEEPPTDVLIPYGQIVLLERGGRDDDRGEQGQQITTARWATPEQFVKLVYLNPYEHPMDRYLDNVLALLRQSGLAVDQALFDAVSA
ncbi:hypothetical protein JCM24511_03684 [Saitozyma sp. JCM 24511]|nr:hypothetical protein JCM24511_03684 [Saitozyma sp. JCM 24511]